MRVSKPLTIATLSVLAAACATTGASQDVEPLFVRHTMQAEVNPAIVGVWDVGNNAMNDTGGLDAALMTPELWDALAASAGDLAIAGEKMANATEIRAAAPGNMATEEYEVSMEAVQGFIDADPDGFRREATEFATMARALETAAKARDIDTAGELVANMDSECAVCHATYWYAE